MTKKILCFVAVVCSLLLFYNLAFAQFLPIFGPNKYERTTEKSNTYSASFQACNAGAAYKLTIENGEDGQSTISSASITLNGQEIVKENEFNQNVDKIEKTISLQHDNTLNIKLASGPGGFIKVSVFCVANCLEVNVTTPTTGSAINKSKTIIKGNLYNAFGETGVILKSSGASGEVSGLAQTQAANFAGSIPLQIGANTITATGTDACGYKATNTITINTETLQEPIRLTAIPNSGIPKLEVSLKAEINTPNPINTYQWDLDGNGNIDLSGNYPEVINAYLAPGLYFPKVIITDSEGSTYTETTIVNVLSKEEMDALFKGKWDGMRGELGQGNVEKAVSFFEQNSQSTYRDQFTALQSVLNTIASDMNQINLVKVEDDRAEYEIITTRNGATYSFHLLFVMDKDGLWKIKVF